MDLHGKNLIGSSLSAEDDQTFTAYNPREGKHLETAFHEATSEELVRAAELAEHAASEMRALNADQIAEFLSAIREELLGLGDALIETADRETALGIDRLRGERDRTTNQIKLFADLVREGSWVDAPSIRLCPIENLSRDRIFVACCSRSDPLRFSAQVTFRWRFRWQAATLLRRSPRRTL